MVGLLRPVLCLLNPECALVLEDNTTVRHKSQNMSGTDFGSEAPDRHKGAQLLLELRETAQYKEERAAWHELAKGRRVHRFSLMDY